MATSITPNVLDHQVEEPVAREQVNKFLIESGIEEGITCPLIFTRFTPQEYQKVSLYYPGDIFTHINLQHYGIPHEFEKARYQLGVRILNHGVNLSNKHIAPEVNLGSGIILKQIKLRHSIDVAKPAKHDHLLLQNDEGILDSLYTKYNPPMKKKRPEIAKMKYFARTFEVIDYIKLDI